MLIEFNYEKARIQENNKRLRQNPTSAERRVPPTGTQANRVHLSEKDERIANLESRRVREFKRALQTARIPIDGHFQSKDKQRFVLRRTYE